MESGPGNVFVCFGERRGASARFIPLAILFYSGWRLPAGDQLYKIPSWARDEQAKARSKVLRAEPSTIMSAVCILTPVVIMAWPAFSAAVIAAAGSLGYQVAAEAARQRPGEAVQKEPNAVQLEIERSEVVTSQLGRDQRISVTRDGVTVSFSRDARGRASLCVSGSGHSDEALRALGEELSQAVVQQYVYRKLMDEMRARGFNVVEEEVNEDRSIRLKVRHWEN